MTHKVIEGENDDLKKDVKSFWNSSVCGTFLAKNDPETAEYFREIEDLRYEKYPYAYGYLKKKAGFDKYAGKKVLEIGCGAGTDLSQFARNGAITTGVDLTESAIDVTRKRFQVLGLKGDFKVADAENLPFKDNEFDLVYSFGVLHHTPNTQKTIDEVYRVLQPGGKTFIMLYYTYSFEYLTLILRKLIHPDRWKWSVQEAVNYETEMNKKVGGKTNPLTKTYSKQQAKKMFSKFKNVKLSVEWIRVPIIGGHVPEVVTKPFSKVIGWHLIIEATK